MTNREDGPSEKSESIHQKCSPEQIRQAKEPHSDRYPNEPPKQEEEAIRKRAIFFRIWFGLKKRELVKIALDVLRNEIGWYEKPENGIGQLTSRIINDTSMVKVVIADRMSVIVQCISSILIATVVSMYVNWRMGLVAWAVMPCHFIGGLIQAKSAKGFAGDSAAAHNELVSVASESAQNIRTVASFCHEDHILKKAEISLETPKKRSMRQSIKFGIIQGVSLCLWNITQQF
ncbi:hypothetical protein ACLB2K_020549 [Fragaria x ananassa]